MCKYTKLMKSIDKYWNKYYYSPTRVLEQVQIGGVMRIYLRSHRRRPILLWRWWGRKDAQGEIPWFWCCKCGAEVFTPGATRCSRCKKEETYEEDLL